jgi:hypothetical protein
MLHPEAFGGLLKERGQPYMQFVLSHGKWDPHLEVKYPPINSNYGTSVMFGYGRPPEGLIHFQIPILSV